jgi:hypothetical protein
MTTTYGLYLYNRIRKDAPMTDTHEQLVVALDCVPRGDVQNLDETTGLPVLELDVLNTLTPVCKVMYGWGAKESLLRGGPALIAHMQVQVLMDAADRHPLNLRCIVFVQQRLTTHILQHYLNNNDSPIIRRLKTACVYATSSPASMQYRVTKQEAEENIRAFATGAVEVLLATSYAEEGLDVQVWLYMLIAHIQ